MALIPPEDTNKALAWLDCRTAPSKSEGRQLKNEENNITQYAFISPEYIKHYKSVNINAERS